MSGQSNPQLLIAVMGATASGKTDLAEQLADELGGVLINADAFQVYRGMDIGTSKPTDRNRYCLLDLKNPDEQYGLGEFCGLACDQLNQAWPRGQSAIVVGGTGLYIRALFEQYSDLADSPPTELRKELAERLRAEGLETLVMELKELDPAGSARVDLKNPIRVTRALERLKIPNSQKPLIYPPFTKLKLGLSVSTNQLLARIELRAHAMVQNGWVKEIVTLLDQGFHTDDPGFRAIGYRSIAEAVLNKTGLEEAITTTIVETRQYAKRQRTWLRSEPNLVNIDATTQSPFDAAMVEIERLI